MTIHPIETGALARITQDFYNEYSKRQYRKGHEFIIEDYVNAEESDDGVPFYWGSTHKSGNINDVAVSADRVELIKTEAAMNSRTLPSANAIAEYLASEALGFGGEDFSFSEGDYSAGDGTLELYGRTTEGLPMSVTVKVIRIVMADD